MKHFHAVAFVDHQHAQIIPFGTEHAEPQVEHGRSVFTRQQGSLVRTEHEFYAQVCDALDGFAGVLVVGGHTGLADFRHYVQKHRPHTAPRISDYQVVDHPTPNEMVALARKYFVRHDKMVGISVPN